MNVKFCFALYPRATSRLLHDNAKIHATSARLYNVLGKLAGNENSFPSKYFDPRITRIKVVSPEKRTKQYKNIYQGNCISMYIAKRKSDSLS